MPVIQVRPFNKQAFNNDTLYNYAYNITSTLSQSQIRFERTAERPEEPPDIGQTQGKQRPIQEHTPRNSAKSG
ncbi:hypothetical protein GCM10027217_32040 [Pseudomaricurvus hydrocarbonicus]